MLCCKEVASLVSESLDRALPLGRRLSLGLHLFLCPPCSRFRRQLRWLRRAAGAFAEKEGALAADVRLSPQARARLKQSLARGGR